MKKYIVAAASFYKQKYFMDPAFSDLPKEIRTEMQVLAVCSAEKIRGVFIIGFYENGDVYLEAQREENDFEYDDIQAELVCGELLKEKEELIKSLRVWYSAFKKGKQF